MNTKKSELDRVGRYFTKKQLEQRRREHCAALRKAGKFSLAESYEKMTLIAYGAYTGKVIKRRK